MIKKATIASVLVCLSFAPAAAASVEQVSATTINGKPYVIRGLLGQQKDDPYNFQYLLLDGSILQIPQRIPKVKDLRPWRKKHDAIYGKCLAFKNFCIRVTPFVNFGGSACQIWSCFKK